MNNKNDEIYSQEELINIKLSKKDYLVLKHIIERDKSLKFAGKLLFSVIGGIITLSVLIKTGVFKWLN